MYKFTFFCFLFCAIAFTNASAQNSFVVTDVAPVNQDGLTMGYTIKNIEQKQVGSKGNFSRYSIQFYVTNPTSEAKIILYKQGWNIGDNVNDQLAQFNCVNATGARLTSKSVIISAAPCSVLAMVEDKDGNGKIIQTKRFVQIGSWIKAGQTFTTSAIVIVPLDEKPDMQVVYLANQLQPVASASVNYDMQAYDNTPAQNNRPAPPPPTPAQPVFSPDFARIMNVSTATYLNNQDGPLVCGNLLDNAWWSAQWKLVSVMGGQYYIIKNKWKGNFISTQNPISLLSDDYNDQGALWNVETIGNTNMFYLRNVKDGTYLNITHGSLQTTIPGYDRGNARWTFVQ